MQARFAGFENTGGQTRISAEQQQAITAKFGSAAKLGE
jgi:hypothetical protein